MKRAITPLAVALANWAPPKRGRRPTATLPFGIAWPLMLLAGVAGVFLGAAIGRLP